MENEELSLGPTPEESHYAGCGCEELNQNDLLENQSSVEEPVAIDPQEILNASPLLQFFEEIKANPRKYNDKEMITKIFALTEVVYGQCLDARLPQTAEILFNQVGTGFTILMRILMAKHGVQAIPMQQPPQEQQPESNLITL